MATSLGGTYRKLVRLAARAFFDEPLQMRDDDGVQRLKAMKYETRGLSILIVDALTKEEWINEAELAEKLRVNLPLLKRVMRFLETEQVVMREHRRQKLKRDNGTIQDVILSFAALDYPTFVDYIQLKLFLTRQKMTSELEEKDKTSNYICPVCAKSANPYARQRSKYTDFDLVSLLDPFTGRIRCPTCSTDLREDDGTADMDPDVSRIRAERRKKMRDLLHRFDEQMRPLSDLLTQLKDIAPPDHGTLEQWAMLKRQQAEQARRAHEAAGGSGRGNRETMLVYQDGNQGRAEAVTLHFDMDGGDEFANPKPAEKKAKVLAPWHSRPAAPTPTAEGAGAGPSSLGATAAGGQGTGAGVGTNSVQDLYIQEYLKAMQAQQQQQDVAGAAKKEEETGLTFGADDDEEWEDV